jgi:hypothetical protein
MADKIHPLRVTTALGCWMKPHRRMLSGIFTAGFVLGTALLPNPARGADTPSRYEYPKFLTGTIYAANSDLKRVLYKFKRTVTTSGNSLTAVREFTAPDGTLAARETVVYLGNDLVSFELVDHQAKTRATVKLSRPAKTKATIDFHYISGNNTRTNVASESLRSDTLISDMIAPFLTAHWDDLLKGKEVKFRFVAAERAETIGFKFAKHAESIRNGKPVIVLKMSPSSFVVAAFVDPIFVTMEKDGDHRVLQYDGRTTPKIKDGNEWKDLDAVTVFHWDGI